MNVTELQSPSQAMLLARLLVPMPEKASLEAAKYILDVKFSKRDIARMNRLAEKARQGTLNGGEQRELDDYCHIGNVLERMKSDARRRVKELTDS